MMSLSMPSSIPNPSTPYHSVEDGNHLQSIDESLVFLHDGVLRSISAQSLKDFETRAKYHDALTFSSINQIEELMTVSPSNVDELSKKIVKLSTLHVQAIGLHHRYQWYIMDRMWRHKYNRAMDKDALTTSHSADATENEADSDQAAEISRGLGFKLNLCLLVPMLESFATQNSDVALSSMNLIFDELVNMPVMSLKESSKSLEKLEDLLCVWAASPKQSFQTSGPSAMVALACARGMMPSFAKTILMLENLDKPQLELPVGNILAKLTDVRTKMSKPCAILSEKHVTTWPYDDRLLADALSENISLGTISHPQLALVQEEVTTEEQDSTNRETDGRNVLPVRPTTSPGGNTTVDRSARTTGLIPEEFRKHYVATDGQFLFVTGPDGKGVAKIGTGMRGTVQGYVYQNNVKLNSGHLAYADGILISRPLQLDTNPRQVGGKIVLGVTLNLSTLHPEKLVLVEATPEWVKPYLTLAMISDGASIFLVWTQSTKSSQSSHPPQQDASGPSSTVAPRPIGIFMDVFRIENNNVHVTIIPEALGVALVRQEDSESDKTGEGRTLRKIRSVRLQNPPPPPPPPGPIAPTTSNEMLPTSLNVNLKQLEYATYFTCGNYLSIIVSTHSQLTLPPAPGPTSGVAPTMRQYAPVMSPTISKSIGIQLHLNLSQLSSSNFTKQDFASLPPDSSFFHGSVIPEIGACYDPINNLIWTMNGCFVDVWKNTGHIPPWRQNELRSPQVDITNYSDSNSINAKTVINLMIQHGGIMATHLLLGDRQDANIGFSGHILPTMIDLLYKYQRDFEGPELTSMFLMLQAIVSQLKTVDPSSEVYKNLHNIQMMVLVFLNDPIPTQKFRASINVYKEACKLFAMSFDLLYTTFTSRNDFFVELYSYFEKNDEEDISKSRLECLGILEEAVLFYFLESLKNPCIDKFEDGVKWIVETQWITKIVQRSNEQIRSLFNTLVDKNFTTADSIHMASSYPVTSILIRYLDTTVNFLLRCLTIHGISRQWMDTAVNIFREVIKAGPPLVDICIESISTVDHLNLAIYNASEAILKSSVLGHGIPQLLAFLSFDSAYLFSILDELTEEIIQLTVALSFLANKLNSGTSHEHGDDWSLKVKVPSPWSNKKTFESPHPIREGLKVKESVVLPPARQLLIKLSPQCASQYDYDRLIFTTCGNTPSGLPSIQPSTCIKKVVEFGGNYFGYGNRYFSGPGWARTMIRIDGNSLGFTFEMKSGREHNVPDKALHGYHFNVYPVLDYSEVQKPGRSEDDIYSLAPVNTGFCTLTALHCIDTVQNMTRALLQGDFLAVEEHQNALLLENRLVASLKWPSRQTGKDTAPKKYSSELITKLKRCIGVPPLQMRLSLIEKMRVAELEELYLQCCIQHIGTNPYVSQETITLQSESTWTTEPVRDILRAIFQNVDTIFRRLMALYEMEKMFCQEIEEISNGTKDVSEAFFSDPLFVESISDLQTLAWICYLELDKDNPGNLIHDVMGMVNALSADGTTPELTRADELIEETHAKCKYLLAATPNETMTVIGPVYPSSKWVIERLRDIHGFIAAHLSCPNATVNSFIEARRKRRERAGARIRGLDIMHKVLECSSPTSALLIVTATLLQSGPRLDSITCSGLEKQVIKIFGEVLKSAVSIAEKNPFAHRYTIALLSVTPYDRTDEGNLVDSGLVGLLDQLCAFQTGSLTPIYRTRSPTEATTTDHGSKPTPETALTHNKASSLAWAAFQVLASQCASWERCSKLKTCSDLIYTNDWDEWDEPEHRELPFQIAINVTNHLARAAALAALSSSQLEEQSSCSPSLTVAIQDVLDLLNNLRTYKIGRAILKQSPCICRLLGLLQDSRLSPRLVLTILKLLHTALPLVDDLDTANFKEIVPRSKTPFGGNGGGIGGFWTIIESTPYTQVASMLLTKLADYLVCGSQSGFGVSKLDTRSNSCNESTDPVQGLTHPSFDKMEVWLQKASDQSTSSLLRQLFVDMARQDLKPTRATLNDLEHELTANGKVMLYTDESSVAERKALRISQLGHLVTLVPVGYSRPLYHPGTGVNLSRGAVESLCKDRNSQLSAWDPTRPFLSGHVAENLASQIVQLLRVLLSSSSRKTGGKVSTTTLGGGVPSTTSITSGATIGSDSVSLGNESIVSEVIPCQSAWPGSVEQVICAALRLLPRLLAVTSQSGPHFEAYVYSSRLVIAALTVLGGFSETIRPGLEVWIVDKENGLLPDSDKDEGDEWDQFIGTKARVISVNEVIPTARVEVISKPAKPKGSISLSISDTLTVTTCRLVPAHFKSNGMPNLPELSRLAQMEIATVLKSLFLPPSHNAGGGPSTSKPSSVEYTLKKSLPTLAQILSLGKNGGGNSQMSESRVIAQAMTTVRLMAEIRTKSVQVLSLWLKKKEFSDIFLGLGSESQFQSKRFGSDVTDVTTNLKELSQQCIPSHKGESLESQVAWMRLLYRDCTKPPRLPITTSDKSSDGMRWDMSRTFPKIRCTVFSSLANSLVYTGDYNVFGGNPRGLLVFGNSVISSNGFYWEATIVSTEDAGQHTELIVVPPLSIGYSMLPAGTSSADVWKYPSGAVMFTTLGRVIHYKSQDTGTWVTQRLDDDSSKIKVGDTIGIGWEKDTQTPLRARRILRVAALDDVGSGRRGRMRGAHVDTPVANSSFGVRGVIFFTLNGRRLPVIVEQSNCSLHPILHIQKRQMVVHTNLGEKPFVYEAANKSSKSVPPPRNNDEQASSSSAGRVEPQVTTEEQGTSNADVLLRSVSDSLQDLNLVLNLNDFDSEHELDQVTFSGSNSSSNSTLSYVNDQAQQRHEIDWNDPAEDEGDSDDDDDDDDGEENVAIPSAQNAIDTVAVPQQNSYIPRAVFLDGGSVSGTVIGTLAIRDVVRRPVTARTGNNDLAETSSSWTTFHSPAPPATFTKSKNERIGKGREKMKEYNPIKSQDYYMNYGPTTGIKVFQGPPRYMCPCVAHSQTPMDFLFLEKGELDSERRSLAGVDMDSLDGYEDEDDDDIHSLLVKAWETSVFPTIRRRFRNESERRDGLEQIRGALQLGMIDIARQTVEFLYEDGGGPPRDLHFPTLEQVRAEAVKCTMDKVKAGMNVLIRPIQQVTDANLLPTYAVTPMLRTFGLLGEVLEVDLAHDLVLVETYIESEGLLVRYWYPVTSLDKSQSNKKPTLSTSTVNMFKLHSNLISMECSLCHLYSRTCYLTVAHQCNNVQTKANVGKYGTKIKTVPAIQQIRDSFDLESIQILSDDSLANYPASRDMFTYNLGLECPSLEFLSDSGNPSVIFYKEPQLLAKHIREKIVEESGKGEEAVDTLTACMLRVLESGDNFPHHDLTLDKIVDVEVYLPNAAFTLVSFKGPQMSHQMTAIDNTSHPCLHMSSYDSSGVFRHLMACFPLEPLHSIMHRSPTSQGSSATAHTAPTSTANAALTKTVRKRHSRLPPIMAPTDRLHCSISDTNLPEVTVDIQGIPKEFPLALLYVQEFVREMHSEQCQLSFTNVTNLVTKLFDFLEQFHLSPVIKDWIFTLIAELTRVTKAGIIWKPAREDRVSQSCTPNRLLLELLLLRDKESEHSVNLPPPYLNPITNALSDHVDSSKITKGKRAFAPASLMEHISNLISFHQKQLKGSTEPVFSFYFNSLNDLCLALNEVSELIVNPYEIIPCSASTDVSPLSTPQRRESPLTTVGNTPSGVVQLPNKRTIPKVIRKRGGVFLSRESKYKDVNKTAGGSGANDKVATNKQLTSVSSEESGLQAFAKSTEIDWFNTQVIISRVLRDIVWHSPNDSCNEPCQALVGTIIEKLKTSTVHQRLLVVQGAPVNIDGMSIEASLIRALRTCGGIHGNEMWISGNSAVVEIRTLAKINDAYELLKQNKMWYPLEDCVLYPPVNVYRVGDNFSCSDAGGDMILRSFLKSKISDPELPEKMSFAVQECLTSIYMSCYALTLPFEVAQAEEQPIILLSADQINLKVHGNLLAAFVSGVNTDSDSGAFLENILNRFGDKLDVETPKPSSASKTGMESRETADCLLQQMLTSPEGPEELPKELPMTSACVSSQSIGKKLSLRGFLEWCTSLVQTNHVNVLWKGLFAAGLDMRLDRLWLAEEIPQIYQFYNSSEWSKEKDSALVAYVDQFAQSLHIDSSRIQPSEVYFTESDFLQSTFTCLQGVALPRLRVRWGMIQKMNTLVVKKLLPHASLHSVHGTKRSLANLLHDSRHLLSYFSKDAYLHKVIHVSASRGSDLPTPEITVDPVSSIGSQDDVVLKNQLSQVIQQMCVLSTAFYCVPPATGADPALPISVKFQGEEVLGLSGSFRHFLLNSAKEVQSERVKLLCRCPSADAGRNKDSFIITPGKLAFGDEDFLHFFGQLIGISMRADAPLAISLLKSSWRALLVADKEVNDSSCDLTEVDVLCSTYLTKLESLTTKMAFDNFLSLNAWPKFQYPSMDNATVVPLCADGFSLSVSYANKDEFVRLIKLLREKELMTRNKVGKILAGLATLIPLPTALHLFTSTDLELRVAGSPQVNLSLLKSHTHYQVGVSENDPHITYFWAALESFSPEELRRFVKFSANLERLPVTCPCQALVENQESTVSNNANVVHVPPFPMKIAPIDLGSSVTSEEIDKRLIRVETCLFLIRLPPYSSLQVTRQQLLFAINCREDPLSG